MLPCNRRAFIIADHRPLLRQTLQQLLTNTFTPCTINQAADTPQLLQLASAGLYHAVFIDHSLPPHGGFEAFAQLELQYPGSRVILFGADSDKHKVTDALINGAAAFFSWHDEPAHIVHTVQEVLQRCVYITHEQMQLIRSMEQHRKRQTKLPQLTKREKQELALLAKGHSTKEIAAKLYIGIRTAGNYRNNLLCKTGTHNTIELLNFAKQAGWIDDEKE